jgi:chaperonin GroEL (HSP60 family)
MNEVERNLQDAMAVTKNIFLDPMVVPGGGATEMSMGAKLAEKVSCQSLSLCSLSLSLLSLSLSLSLSPSL